MAQTMAKAGWKLTALLFAVPAGIAARKAVDVAWKKARHSDPPANPAAPGTTWTEALVWAAISGVVFAAARMVAARGAAATWRSLTGSLPPGLEDSTV
ncbi:MAG: hypothetical protein DLM59_04000 [Pseudonocardiales bacterium]|nr:MAG: hypothetical protein DLM59_04000 [Pseudonocardiales bacterium]